MWQALILAGLAGCEVLRVIDRDFDEDGDGYLVNAKDPQKRDCNDDDPAINPGAVEGLHDGVDQNCNGMNDEDVDGDGVTVDDGDCDDNDPSVSPRHFEWWKDGKDNTCDEFVDESNPLVTVPSSTNSPKINLVFALDASGFDSLYVGLSQNGDGYRGEVLIVSSDGQILETLSGTEDFARFGSALASLGDVGVAIGAEGANGVGSASGEVWLYSAASLTGPVFSGDTETAQVGASLASLEPQEENATLLVGAPGSDAVYLLSDLTGSAVASSTPFVFGDADSDFGAALASGGDIDGDGMPDYLVGAPSALSADGLEVVGSVSLYSQGSSSAEATWLESSGNAGLGSSLAIVGDVNGDWYDDFLVGAPYLSTWKLDAGAAYLVLGSPNLYSNSISTQAQMFFSCTTQAQELGINVAYAGDVDGDGFDDILISGLANSDGVLSMATAALYLGVNLGNGVYSITQADALFGGDVQCTTIASLGGATLDSLPYTDSIIRDDFSVVTGDPTSGNLSVGLFYGQPY